MPDLNLIDEGEFEETASHAAPPPPVKKKKSSGASGGGTSALMLILILVVLGAGVYFLNKRGLISVAKLWKKSPAVTQVQEEPLPPEQPAEQMQQPQKSDSSEVALLETAPVEDSLKGDQTTEAAIQSGKSPAPQTPKQKKMMKETASISKQLDEMKGEFTVQVIAYREKTQAEATAKNLEYVGYPSFVEKVPMKGGDWYTVRIGRYASREEAKHAVKSFAAQLQASYVIDKVRSK
ncbi:MAG TPA: SPOR domain-containing protein [Bacteroidota bacterium]|nr:SPOR domain-containing protein [Bacteroidota bacterium]